MTDQRLDLSAKFVPPAPTGLVRGRLLDFLDHRVGLVLAPAGHGKTTLLGQIASSFDGEVGWYRLDAGDRDPDGLATRIGRVLLRLAGPAAPASAPGGTSFERLAGIFEAVPPAGAALLVLDDFHLVAGTESERGLVRLISLAPPWLRVLLGARRAGGLDVEALRIYGGVRVLDAGDLRFRSWEVESLFREVYRRPLAPEEAATLTRRTEGWAAGLAMFHLLTAGRAPAQRRQALADLSRGTRLVRTYLVREVLGDLPPPLREFMRRTSALGVLTGELCDALLDTTGSQAVLEELEQRRLFTTTHDDGRQFAYHQVLLDHLELELTEQLGRSAAREWYSRAARLLLTAGEVPAAFRAYARAEDWTAVEQLLHVRGAEVVATGLGSVENLLPVNLNSHDPWLLLARARRLVAHGDLAEAVTTFKLARSVAEDADLAARCFEEAQAAAVWLPDAGGPFLGWAGLVRAATQRAPRQVLPAALALPGPHGRLAAGVIGVLAGDVDVAAGQLGQAAAHPEADFEVVAMARCAEAVLDLLVSRDRVRGRPDGRDARRARAVERAHELEALLVDAEAAGNRSWLLRIGRALLTGPAGPPVGSGSDRDAWGHAVASFVDGLARRSPGVLAEAAERLTSLGAPVPAQWATCLAEALAVQADPGRTRDEVWSGPAGQRARALGLRDALAVIDAWAARATREAGDPVPHGGTPAPAFALPAAARPEVALPEVALPAAALPEVALPAAALPEVALPAAGRLANAHPAIGRPEVAHPAVAHPPVAHPAVGSPAAGVGVPGPTDIGAAGNDPEPAVTARAGTSTARGAGATGSTALEDPAIGPLVEDGATEATAAMRSSVGGGRRPVAGASIELRLLGGFEIAVGGVPVDVRGVRPRARSTLRYLALRAGELVHRETLASDLWPDLDQEAALRGLQVAISSLRSLLEPAVPGAGPARSRPSLLIRVGQNYGLSLPPGCRSDVQEVPHRLGQARAARASGDRSAERDQLEAVLRLYRGDLLPEEGVAEWVLPERERLRLAAAGAAEALARCLVGSGDVTDAIDVLRVCLRLEPYRDNAWRLLVDLHTEVGNVAAAEAARLEHGQVLAELGL